MILIIETVRGPNEHMTLNASILKSLNISNEDIFFLTSKDYWHSFDRTINKNITLIESSRLNHGFLSLMKTLLLTFRILVLNNKYQRIIFLSSLTYNSLFCALLQKLGFSRANLGIFLHETSYLDIRNHFSIKLAAKALSAALKIGLNKNSHFLIIGGYIEKELKSRVNYSKESVKFLEHPININSIFSISRPRDTLKLASVGVQNLEKNSHFLEQLVELNKNLVIQNHIVFSTIGRLDIETNNNDLIQHHSLDFEDYLIPAISYEKIILDQDYLLFFYRDGYNLKTSGCILDAIKYQKPIIALHSNITNYYFKKFGDIGHLCQDLNQMTDLIKSIHENHDLNAYNSQVKTMLKAKKTLNVDNFQKELNDILGI